MPDQQYLSTDPNEGVRADGTPKGKGFFGELPRKDGGISTEISVGVNIDGKEVQIPTLVPTLSPREKQWLLENDISDPKRIPQSILNKAVAHARERIAKKESPFADTPSAPNSDYLSTDPNDGVPLRVNSRAQTWSDRLGLNEPIASMPSLGALEPVAAASAGFMRGVGSGAVDLAQGAASSIINKLNQNPHLPRVDPKRKGGMPAIELPQSVDRPSNVSGAVGSALPDLAMMVAPAGDAASAVKGVAGAVLPSAERAGAKFQQVLGAAKDITVDVGPAGDRALRIYDLAQKGAYLPKPVANFLQWVTSPTKAPLAYKDSRDFASAISRLSASERASMTPVVKREVAQMAADLNLANANAAKAAGKGAEYKSAMREYANAMQMRDAIDAAMKHSKKAALGAAGLGGAYYLFGKD